MWLQVNFHIKIDALKKFLAKLETPLIPYEQFNRLMGFDGLTSAHILAEVKIMEKNNLTNLLTLIVLIDFLKKDVIPLQK